MREKGRFQSDDRGVSEVIGAILVFGLAIALMAVLQTQAIPAANEKVEFNHNQEVQEDIVKFHEAASRVVSDGRLESVRVRMGTNYPNRLLFFNPPSPAGNLRTSSVEEVRIENLSSGNPHMKGSLTQLETRRLSYKADYQYYTNSPTNIYEYGILYSEFDDTEQLVNEGSIINGNNVNLVFVAGELDTTTSGVKSLDARPTSAPSRSVSVSGENGDPIRITLPTRMDLETWETLVEGEPHATVEPVAGKDAVDLVLDGSKTYNFRMAQVGIGSAAPRPGGEYMVTVGSSDRTVTISSQEEVTVEVRDRYNNPVSGETVNLTVEEGELRNTTTTAQTVQATTDEQGRVTVVYEVPDQEQANVKLDASFDKSASNANPSNKEDVQFTFDIIDPGIIGEAPEIQNFEISERTCSGTILPGVQLSPGEAGFALDYWVTDANSNLDTVELRMIRTADRTIADSIMFDIAPANGDEDDRDDIVLTDDSDDWDCAGGVGNKTNYDLRIIATDENNRESDETIEDQDADA